MEPNQLLVGSAGFAGGIIAASWFAMRIATRYALLTDQKKVTRFLLIASSVWAIALFAVLAFALVNASPFREVVAVLLYWFGCGLVAIAIAVSAWNGIGRLFRRAKVTSRGDR